LGENETFPVIISSKLNAHQESKLLQTLKIHKNALGWTITDIKELDIRFALTGIWRKKLNPLEKCNEGSILILKK
jgi:hypothetical protein